MTLKPQIPKFTSVTAAEFSIFFCVLFIVESLKWFSEQKDVSDWHQRLFSHSTAERSSVLIFYTLNRCNIIQCAIVKIQKVSLFIVDIADIVLTVLFFSCTYLAFLFLCLICFPLRCSNDVSFNIVGLINIIYVYLKILKCHLHDFVPSHEADMDQYTS